MIDAFDHAHQFWYSTPDKNTKKKPARGLGTNDFIISQDIAHEENKDKTLDRIIIPTKKCC